MSEDRQGEEGDGLLVVTDELEQLPRGRRHSLKRCGGLCGTQRVVGLCMQYKVRLGLVSIACMPCPCYAPAGKGWLGTEDERARGKRLRSMARFTAASISGSLRSTRLRRWNRLVLARFTAVEATICDRRCVPDRTPSQALAGLIADIAGCKIAGRLACLYFLQVCEPLSQPQGGRMGRVAQGSVAAEARSC